MEGGRKRKSPAAPILRNREEQSDAPEDKGRLSSNRTSACGQHAADHSRLPRVNLPAGTALAATTRSIRMRNWPNTLPQRPCKGPCNEPASVASQHELQSLRELKRKYLYSIAAAILIVGSAALVLGHYTPSPDPGIARSPDPARAVAAAEVPVGLPRMAEDPADFTTNQPTRCEIHRIAMRTVVMPIRNGQLDSRGVPSTSGGSGVAWDGPSSARIRICPECERGLRNRYTGHRAIP